MWLRAIESNQKTTETTEHLIGPSYAVLVLKFTIIPRAQVSISQIKQTTFINRRRTFSWRYLATNETLFYVA